ncbi:C39 family peptidase [Bacillus sp. 1P06AnD]|uniref:C39 family peptidase n=1 Tax=Bacillus sp. 1P06AnD TaxID=3132208 RepID=UPI0039A07587
MKRLFTKKNIILFSALSLFIVIAGVSLGTYLQGLVRQNIANDLKFARPEKEELSEKSIYNREEREHPLLKVPLIQQMPELPRGCEVTALAMLLQYQGFKANKMALAGQIAHESFSDGQYRGNMHNGFVGDMGSFDQPGLGVFVEPVIELAKAYAGNERVVNMTGKQPEDLYGLLEKGIPVWVLTNVQFKALPESEFQTWQTKAGPMRVTYRQHSVVLTGYDASHVYVNDPLQPIGNRVISRQAFEKSWVQMGSQAMAIMKY